MDKKKSERDILHLVYDEQEYGDIVESERPDFWIRHCTRTSFFGVEVTEFYYSESNARLHKIPSYFNDIISRGRYLHKVDKTAIRADNVQIISPEGKIKSTTRGILQELPKPEEYVDMVADVIESKDQKFPKYDKTLEHINLIIYDTERRLQTIQTDQFYEYFYASRLKKVLFKSNFREIYFVTILNDDRHVFIPLKMLLLLAEYHLFGKLIMDYPWETSEDESSDEVEDDSSGTANLMRFFSKYLRAKTDRVYIRNDDGIIEVILDGCGMILDEGCKAIRNYYDYPLPKDAKSVEEDDTTAFFLQDDFIIKAQEVLADVTFYADIAFDINSDIGS